MKRICPRCKKNETSRSYCRLCTNEWQRQSHARRYKENSPAIIERNREWRLANPDKVSAVHKRYHLKLRQEALFAYGGEHPVCVCCGEDHYEFLAIDHVNGGGSKERRLVHGNIYRFLRKEGYPQNGKYQVLCHNCNSAKGYYGKCPHQL